MTYIGNCEKLRDFLKAVDCDMLDFRVFSLKDELKRFNQLDRLGQAIAGFGKHLGTFSKLNPFKRVFTALKRLSFENRVTSLICGLFFLYSV